MHVVPVPCYNNTDDNYIKQVLTSEAFEAFYYSSIFDKAVFCLDQKQGMLINDECSSCHNKVGDLLMSVWDRRKEILYGNRLV